MAGYGTLDIVDVRNKRVLVRVDLNVPIEDGRISDLTRIQRAAPTLKELVSAPAKVAVLSHFGRPKGKVVPEMSLEPVTEALASAVGSPVSFLATDWQDMAVVRAAVDELDPGSVVLLENTRFHPGEEANEPAFARGLAELGDVYVNDAFSAAHRAHASTEGVAHHLPAVAGRAMEAELDALTRALEAPERPLAAIVGGAKISTKLKLLGALTAKVNQLIVGGGMANTFLAAQGLPVGKSLCEHNMLGTAKEILLAAEGNGCTIVLPRDAVVAETFEAQAPHRVLPTDQVGPNDMILDVGPESLRDIERIFANARTLVWNGPLGAFELEPFDAGTNAAARMAAELCEAGRLLAVAGGGDTVAALNHAGAAGGFTYISTAGGAFLEWLEGKTLPGVLVLQTTESSRSTALNLEQAQ